MDNVTVSQGGTLEKNDNIVGGNRHLGTIKDTSLQKGIDLLVPAGPLEPLKG